MMQQGGVVQPSLLVLFKASSHFSVHAVADAPPTAVQMGPEWGRQGLKSRQLKQTREMQRVRN